jgi:outer membrane protein W
MKKIATLAFISFFSAAAFSQTSKNNWLVGGSMGFASSNEVSNPSTPPTLKTTTFSIAPDFGYLFINNLAGGLNVNYISIHTSQSGFTSNGSSFSAGPFARYYFNISNSTKIFVHGNIAWGSQNYGGSQSGEFSMTSPTLYLQFFFALMHIFSHSFPRTFFHL